MNFWKSFGASVTGPGHLATGKPNQDSWLSFHHTWGNGIIVSDGLGSKKYSNFGSHAACYAGYQAALACSENTDVTDRFMIEKIKEKWLYFISPLEPHDCAATCLLAFCIDNVIRVGMLGDGLAAAVKNDGSVVMMSEEKSESFSNITAALSAKTTEKNWRWLLLPENDCSAVLLCTDGVADDLIDPEGFIKEFISAYRNLSVVSSARHSFEMLENWPTPKHSDDKTLACMILEEICR